MGSQAGANLALNIFAVYQKFNTVYWDSNAHKTAQLCQSTDHHVALGYQYDCSDTIVVCFYINPTKIRKCWFQK